MSLQLMGVTNPLVVEFCIRTAYLMNRSSLDWQDYHRVVNSQDLQFLINSVPEEFLERLRAAEPVPVTPDDAKEIYKLYPGQDEFLERILGRDVLNGREEETQKALRAMLLILLQAFQTARTSITLACDKFDEQLTRRLGKWYIVHFCQRVNVDREHVERFDYKQNMSISPIIVQLALEVMPPLV